MSIEQLRTIYEAVNTDRDILTFDLFVEMVDNETNVREILSWFKDSVSIH